MNDGKYVKISKVFRLLMISLLHLYPSYAQKEANTWYFGSKAGISFDTNPPQALTNGQVSVYAGSSAISDKDGNLLFYAADDTVWNKNHQVMANGTGIMGHWSAYQGIVIVPRLGNGQQYYLFTSDAYENYGNRNGVRYSLIDMSRQGGLGEVVEKNKLLFAPGGENLTATGSCGCSKNDYFWVIADKQDGSGSVYAYAVSNGGISNPTLSLLPGIKEIMYLKLSPAGNRLAFAGTHQSKGQVFGIADFDALTGHISRTQFIGTYMGRFFPAAEFSPDGRLLYTTDEGELLYQYNLTLPDEASIADSRIRVGENVYAPQLAPDGKIYFPQNTTAPNSTIRNYLSVLDFPNKVGTASGFRKDAVYLAGRGVSVVLPNFPGNYFYRNDTLELYGSAGPDKTLCSGETVTLGAEPDESIHYQWEPAAHLSSTTIANPVFSYINQSQEPDTLTYLLKASNALCSRCDTVQVIVYPRPAPLPLTGSRSVCPGVEVVEYEVEKIPGYSYQWEVEGGQIASGQGTHIITVNWGPTNPAASVSVVPLNSYGCRCDKSRLPIYIQVALQTETPQGPDSICVNTRENIRYRISRTTGSLYTWGISGGVITSGQGSHQVNVSWHDTGLHKVWLQEKSITVDTICFGNSDTLSVRVFKDTTAVTINSVSTVIDKDTDIIVSWDANKFIRVSNPVSVYRRTYGTDSWVKAGEVTAAEQVFRDKGLLTDEQRYEYKLAAMNLCGEPVESPVHTTILLEGQAEDEKKELYLQWTTYVGWQEENIRYEVWRRLDEETTYTKIDAYHSTIGTYKTEAGSEGFVHHYRIKAVAPSGGYVSWSNEVDLEFTYEPYVPNVFTPNGDGANDTFEITYLELFNNNQLAVYNRWGTQVYDQSNYTGDWNGNNLPAGMYYYSFYAARLQKTYKGWIQILR
ncbi:gliding motility-associated C-terminal domain-containing protein [Rhodocytophaga aerolata]|uniref:Gliding motility-associated C-terminal domain-containing protein n=1 Tax=Rhodocytophaga aerolata TaxID=455078 RepID=A0ABT8RGT6_9BACT|nr:gliding motility-associated C-terminal domain-containing protein [Rhodocytophaga aerolata]MDO1451327.1 gliding motility-associated C-terminal domain-containing protein [Rhodocytophaga aerolata]